MARYSKSAGKDVERAMHRKKKGKLKRGKGGKGGKVKSRKQAIHHRPFRSKEEGQESPQKTQGQGTQEKVELVDLLTR